MLNLKIYFRVVSYPSYSATHSKHRWLVIILFLIEFLWMVKKSLWHRTQTYLPNWLWPLCCTFPFLLRTSNFIHLFSSSGNISAFPLLLHQTDDSNSYLVVYSAHSIITIFYHSFVSPETTSLILLGISFHFCRSTHFKCIPIIVESYAKKY